MSKKRIQKKRAKQNLSAIHQCPDCRARFIGLSGGDQRVLGYMRHTKACKVSLIHGEYGDGAAEAGFFLGDPEIRCD